MRSLKRKEPRLRDWNSAAGWVTSNVTVSLKRKDPRLRDWNALIVAPSLAVGLLDNLKRKDPRLRDWNIIISRWLPISSNSWKEKTLDCEIETKSVSSPVGLQYRHLEKKRPSIARLKRSRFNGAYHQKLPTWKEKTLDCEIETLWTIISLAITGALEKKRPSIARLKQKGLYREVC